MDTELLIKVASVFRDTIENIHWSEFPEECQLYHAFPNGACGDTSLLLGNHFLKKYKIDCDYLHGSCLIEGQEQWTHAWLECRGYKIDITADQFEEVNDKVIVSMDHNLYKQYKVDKSRKISECCYSEELEQAYAVILNKIEERFGER